MAGHRVSYRVERTCWRAVATASSCKQTPVPVIVADDQLCARQGLLAVLGACPDIDVVAEAANGREAVRLAEIHRPALVILDLQMPVMDGIEATRRIKSACPETGVFVLTMYADRYADAEDAGADAFLVKGQSASTLVESIREYAERPPPWSSGAAGGVDPGREDRGGSR